MVVATSSRRTLLEAVVNSGTLEEEHYSATADASGNSTGVPFFASSKTDKIRARL